MTNDAAVLSPSTNKSDGSSTAENASSKDGRKLNGMIDELRNQKLKEGPPRRKIRLVPRRERRGRPGYRNTSKSPYTLPIEAYPDGNANFRLNPTAVEFSPGGTKRSRIPTDKATSNLMKIPLSPLAAAFTPESQNMPLSPAAKPFTPIKDIGLSPMAKPFVPTSGNPPEMPEMTLDDGDASGKEGVLGKAAQAQGTGQQQASCSIRAKEPKQVAVE